MVGIIEISGELGVTYTYQDALLAVERTKVADNLTLRIGSVGGYVEETEKIYNLFKSTNKVTRTENSGDVASSAVKLFLLAPKGQRFFDENKGVFLIHNPFGTLEGDADMLKEASKELEKIENEFINFYYQNTGASKEVLKGFMQINEPLTTEQIETLGFATIKKQEFKAVAKLNNNKMEMTEEKLEKKFDTFFDKMKNYLKKKDVKAIMLKDANDVELNFEVETETEITVGTKVMADDGDYVMPDGRTFVIAGNEITEIKEAAADDTEDVEALKTEIAELKTQIETFTAEKSKMETEIVAFKKEMKSVFKAKKEDNPTPQKPVEPKSDRKPYKTEKE